MKIVLLFLFCSLYLSTTTTNGQLFRWWFRRGRFTYVIRNDLTEPTFEVNVTLRAQTFLRAMERAVNINNDFRFTAEYTQADGYTITGIRGLQNTDGAVWQLTKNGVPVTRGVNRFRSRPEDVIVFNYAAVSGVEEIPENAEA